jgi:hypothetical protein
MEWMHHLSDTVWAALTGAAIASGVSLLTSILSNRNSRKQLRMQLQDNALQRDRDRAMALRRDVYLPAAEAIAHMQVTLGRLLDLDVDQTEIGRQMCADLSTLAKVHLVAKEPTVKALMAHQAVFMPGYLELTILRGTLLIHKAGIANHQKYIDGAEADNHSTAICSAANFPFSVGSIPVPAGQLLGIGYNPLSSARTMARKEFPA